MIPSGLILLHKQPGITSFDALRGIKRALGTGKAGHTGTLDKFAEGLLLVLTGRALKLSKWFTHCDKQYEGTICFGAETDTLDPEGVVIANAPLPSREAVESALAQFRGSIEQAPPAYSAIHIDGERASALARRGEAPEMRKRPVTIYRLELRSWEPPFAKIFVHCSSGTYIRSLARDIALAVGSRAHLTALVRTQVAGFKLEDAIKIMRTPEIGARTGEGVSGIMPHGVGPIDVAFWKQLKAAEELGVRNGGKEKITIPYLYPINRAVFHSLNMPCFGISPDDAQKTAQGKPLANILKNAPPALLKEADTAALFADDTLIAVIEKSNDKWNYGYVYGSN
jgi:tRNA pseudouridine55 synthase